MKIDKIALTLALAAGTFGSYALAAPQTVTGNLTDSMCTTKHMMPGKTNAECARECVKAGAHYVIVSGSKIYNVSGDQKQFYQLAGQKVRVSGDVKGNTIAVSSIWAAK
jgi:hypothetical protein